MIYEILHSILICLVHAEKHNPDQLVFYDV